MRLLPSLIWLDVMACAAPAGGQTAGRALEGHWRGAWVRDGVRLEVTYDFAREGDGFRGSFGSESLRAVGVPVSRIAYSAPKVHFEIVGDTTTAVFDGRLAGDVITGTFVDGESHCTFVLKRAKAEPVSCRQEAVRFQVRT